MNLAAANPGSSSAEEMTTLPIGLSHSETKESLDSLKITHFLF